MFLHNLLFNIYASMTCFTFLNLQNCVNLMMTILFPLSVKILGLLQRCGRWFPWKSKNQFLLWVSNKKSDSGSQVVVTVNSASHTYTSRIRQPNLASSITYGHIICKQVISSKMFLVYYVGLGWQYQHFIHCVIDFVLVHDLMINWCC